MFSLFKKFPKSLVFLQLGIALTLLNGCARNITSHNYDQASVGESSKTFRGKIISIRTVQVSPEQLKDNQMGAVGGGLAGGLLGSTMGSGRGTVAMAGAGALLGAFGGAYAEQYLNTQEAFEYVVELINGELRTIVQGTDVRFQPGQRVYVIESYTGAFSKKGNRSRIVADIGAR